MSNYSFSNTLDGLNNIDANQIDTDNINTDYLTVNINSSVPLVTPYTTNSNQIASCAFVQDAFTNNLSNYVTLNTTQTITGNKTFNGTITRNNTTFDYSDYRFVSVQGGGESTQIYQTAGGMTLLSITNNKNISIATRDISGNAVNNIICKSGNQVTIQGTANQGIDILNNQITMNGNLALNKLFVSNYVDLTLTTYENQFYGDIYGYRGIVCQNGFYVKSSPGAGATTYALIDASGNISTTTNISAQSITLPNNSINDAYLSSNVVLKNGTNNMTGTTNFNTLTNTCLTQTTGTNNTTLANTAFVQNSLTSGLTGYLKLNNGSTNQTLIGTGQLINNTPTTFNDIVVLNSSTQTTNTITFYDGVNATQFDQNGVNLTIYNGTVSGAVKIGTGFNDNIVCVGGNRAYLQGTTGNIIDITGTQAIIGGSSVPKITTQPLAASNTNEIATTQWTKTQLVGTYALLNANQTFTGQNIFANTSSNIPIQVKTNTPLIGNTQGYHYVATAASQYNLEVQANDYVIFAGDSTGAVAPSNLVLTTWSNTKVGIRITEQAILLDGQTISQYAPYNAGYNGLGTTLPLKDNYDLGYIFTIPGSSFTGTSWSTAVTPYNIMTINWNGLGNYTLGVWQCDIVITTNSNASIISGIVWNTISNTNFAVNTTSTWEDALAVFSGGGCQILRLSFVLNVRNLTTTYYLNFQKTGGGGLSANLTASQIQFTRIA